MSGGELEDTLTADPSVTRAPASDDIAAGAIVLGRYEIIRFVAAGAMGEVYEAKDRLVGSTVAVKVIKSELAASPRAIERLLRELAARKVTHPNVCRLHDVHQHGGRAFLSMELLSGESLADRLRRGPLPAAELDDIARQLVAALAALHAADIVHRDFKSSNIMLVPGDGGVRAVVTDFGLARSLAPVGDALLTADATMLGTPAYMAPEQVEGREATPASDIYALGVVLFEMATGTLPFQEETALATATARLTQDPPRPRERRADLAPRWEHTILRCLERAPAARPVRVEDVLAPGPRRARWIPVSAGVTGIAVAATVWTLYPRGEAARPASLGTCAPADVRLRDVWDADVKARIGARYASHSAAYVRDFWRVHARQFDTLAAAWSQHWRDACVSADQSVDPLLYGQRLACLENQLFELRSYVSGLADTRVDAEEVAVGSPGEFPIPPVSDCDNVAYLRAQGPPPPANARAEIDRLMAEFHRLRVQIRFAGNAAWAGQSVDASKELARLDELRARLLDLGYPAGAGDVGYWYGEFLTWFGRFADAERVDEEVIELAERSRDDALLVKSLCNLVLVRAQRDLTYDIAEGEATLQRATRVAARVGDPLWLAEIIAESRVAHARRVGDYAGFVAALARFARLDADAGLTSFALWHRAMLAARIAAHGDPTAAVGDAKQILAEREAKFGANHLLLGRDLIDLSPVFALAGDHEAALAAAERAATIVEQAAATRSWSWAWDAHRAAFTSAFALGRLDVAERHLEQAITSGGQRFGSRLAAYASFADELRARGARDAAAHVLARAAGIEGERADRVRVAAIAEELRAETAPIVGDRPADDVERFRAARDAIAIDVPWAARPRSEADARYGIALVAAGANAEALEPLRRAIWTQEGCCLGAAVIAHEARFALARALVDTGGEREDARALAIQAHAGLAAMGPALASKTSAIEQWLALH